MKVTEQYLKCLQLKLQNSLFENGLSMMMVSLDKAFYCNKKDNKAYETVRLKVYNPNLCTELEGWVSSTTIEEIDMNTSIVKPIENWEDLITSNLQEIIMQEKVNPNQSLTKEQYEIKFKQILICKN